MQPHYTRLNSKKKAYRRKVPIFLSEEMQSDWTNLLNILSHNECIHPPTFAEAPWPSVSHLEYVNITTDASGNIGLGATLGNNHIQRKWTNTESTLPIHEKEFIAVWEAIHTWKELLQNKNVLVWCDNQIVVSWLLRSHSNEKCKDRFVNLYQVLQKCNI